MLSAIVQTQSHQLRHTLRRAGFRALTLAALAASLPFSTVLWADGIYVPLKSFGNPVLSGREPLGELIEASNGMLYGTTRYGGLEGNGAVFRVEKSGSNYLVVHSFAISDDGKNPQAGLVQATDGLLYGTTYSGGSSNIGTVFRLNAEGSNYSVLRSFTGAPSDGANPSASLIEGSDGRLYGTTQLGGASNSGTVFVLEKDGAGYEVVHSFGFTTNDGKYPLAGLIESYHGGLYGTASEGGTNEAGTIFSINKDGGSYSVLRHFKNTGTDARYPHGKLVQVADGRLFGTTLTGSRVFRINTNGTGYSAIGLAIPNGGSVESGLVQGADGSLYGTTFDGGDNNFGSVFRVTTNGAAAVLYDFTAVGTDGRGPKGALLKASDGKLYGTTSMNAGSGNGTIFRLSTSGSGYEVISVFSYTGKDGGFPNAPLIDGEWIYGTAWAGGSDNCGTVFRIKKDGSEYEILRSFETYTAISFEGDGRRPGAGLLMGSNGVLYGTTSEGGSNRFGTVFKISTNGTGYQVLKNFIGGDSEVQLPQSRLVEGTDGALYGTGSGVSIGSGWPFTNYGSIFKLNKDGSGYAVLHVFAGSSGDGRFPQGGLALGSDNYLYGVTSRGGIGGLGTVFKLSQDGLSYSMLRHFPSSLGDGQSPSQIIEGSDGVLYGVTSQGGSYGDYGTIYRINKGGSGYDILRSFSNPINEPIRPATVAEGADGFLYISALSGGPNGLGALIRMAKDGTNYRIVLGFSLTPYRFTDSLTLGYDNIFYGSSGGGEMNLGTLFKLFPPPEITSAERLPNGAVHLTVRGAPGPKYRVEASTSLNNWISLTNLSNPSSVFEFLDHSAINLPSRSYRAVWMP